MTTTTTSTIALVTYETSSRINFAHIVGEMQRSLDKSPQSNYALTWDHDDIATFDFESTRIVLSLEDNAAPTEEPVHDRLLISVGPPSKGPLRRQPEISYEQLCSVIVERVCAYYETQPVYWQQVEECVTSETVDEIFDRIALAQSKTQTIDGEAEAVAGATERHTQENIIHMSAPKSRFPNFRTKGDARNTARARKIPLSMLRGRAGEVANDVAGGRFQESDQLRAVRTALYEEQDATKATGPERNSVAVRLTATAMDATLVVVCLPVGAAMLAYHIFNGGELRRTAQVMTVTGLFLASSKWFASMPLSILFS